MTSNSKENGKNRKTALTADTASLREGFSLISDEKLIALYANLLKCRMVEQRLANGAGARRNYSSSRGHEAGTVGVAIDLSPDDAMCSPDHGIVTVFQKDPPIEAILLLSGAHGLTGRFHSGSRSRSLNGNGAAPAMASRTHTQAAIGAALASKTRKNGRISVVFCDKAASELWNEALHIASLHALPMIFVNREDRKRSPAARTPLNLKTKQPVNPETPWFPKIVVDSNDVVAVYRVANEAISRARRGRGPTLIECQPFRLKGTTRGDGKGSGNGRSALDPISNMETYLRRKGLFQRHLRNDILGGFTKELDATFFAQRAFALKALKSAPSALSAGSKPAPDQLVRARPPRNPNGKVRICG
jgi:TPP-dependent pyruvate/acetoin dehydrogenase alpha subunit